MACHATCLLQVPENGLDNADVDFSTMEACSGVGISFLKTFSATRMRLLMRGVGYCGVNSSPAQPWLPFSLPGDIWHGCLLPSLLGLEMGYSRHL